ncbi:hypothetical protein BZG36_05157 [Bifiguratus adelaidae]|uniref:Carboxylesterase type B domain-containing protein n=1 Tax=Bifiguratus adelaidae TaxID=1938954 RepID=A0A261XVA6_9FUNG|nr:hypothetical protein BZG36_05157 [Bifiguratus adelaidae]
MFWIYGGAFVNGEGSLSVYNGTNLVNISQGRVIMVNLNYRMNAFGFLASEQFGGDPSKITAWGESAGAISIGYLLLANNRRERLFQQGIMISGSVLSQQCQPYKEYQNSHDTLLNMTGCATDVDSLECLRQLNASTLLEAANAGYGRNLLRFYPVVDGHLIREVCSTALINGQFSKIPIIIGTNNSEGTVFVTSYGYQNQSQLATCLKRANPGLTNSSIQEILTLYSETPKYPNLPYPEFVRTANIYVARDYQDVVPVWKYHFNVINPHVLFLGAYHTSDLIYDFDQSTGLSGDAAVLANTMASYYSSFTVSGNPNTYKYAGAIEWSQFQNRTNYTQIVYQVGNATTESDTFLEQKCQFWDSISEQLMH